MNSRKRFPSKPGMGEHKSPTLRTLFPALTQVRMELEFIHHPGRPSATQIHILHPPAGASFSYPCPYGDCSGSFKLDLPVMRLLQRSATVLADEVRCTGVRMQDRNTGKVCASALKYRVEATYGRAVEPACGPGI